MLIAREIHPSAAIKYLVCSLVLTFVGPGDASAAKQMGRQLNEALSAPHSVLSLQVALDRVRFSPGPIDGKMGSNTQKALRAFKAAHALQSDGLNEVWAALGDAANLPLAEYAVTEADVAGPFQPSIPESLEEKAKLEKLSYTGPDELLAEKFHMDIGFLKRLNRGKALDRAGTSVQVASVRRPHTAKAAHIDVDKTAGTVNVFDRTGALIAVYPATIGSVETPSPTGTVKVVSISRNPTYTYDPSRLNFEGITATEKFEIQPGPNNPVGLVWIELSEQG